MKHVAMVVAATALSAMPILGEGLSGTDRQRLLAHFEMTEQWLVDELHGLSKAQLEFRPGPDKWSVKEVVEHLAVAEPQYWQQVQDSLAKPPAEFKREATDAAVLWHGIDRTERQRTAAAREPKDSTPRPPLPSNRFASCG